MRPGDSLLAEIARLRAENDELRERLRHVDELCRPVPEPFPRAWQLTGAQKRMLTLLMRHAPLAVKKAALHVASARNAEPVSQETIVAPQISYLRQRIARLCPSATIETVYGEGYRMSSASKAAILDAIAADPPPSVACGFPSTAARSAGRADARTIRPATYFDGGCI